MSTPVGRPPRAVLGILLLLLMCLAICAEVRGTGGNVHMLPAGGGRLNTTGVRIVVDTRWLDGYGYRPVKLTIHPTKSPAPADRQFRIVIKPQSYYGGGSNDQISQIIDLEQGAVSATATIAVPQDAPWHAILVDVYEDGRLLDELSGDHLPFSRQYWNWNESYPGILLIDSRAPTRDEREALLQILRTKTVQDAEAVYDKQLPDVRNLLRQFVDNNTGYGGAEVSLAMSKGTRPVQLLTEWNDNVRADLVNFQELPERWIDYSSADLIVISRADLAALGQQKPKVLKALAEWTRSGRALVVYNAGADTTGLQEIESLLKLSPLPESGGANRGWRLPLTGERGQPLHTAPDYNNQRTYYGPGMATAMPTEPQIELPPSSEEEKKRRAKEKQEADEAKKNWKFRVRDAGLGYVIAFDGDPFPGTMSDWHWALNSLRGDIWNPVQRLGVSQQGRNEDFWNFLIPGVGQAPVFSFIVFISLFVMVIGPINYIWLQRTQRLYLLLVTVPIGAFLVTASLFLYAMFTDGLGVKSRIRSYTWLDQRTGHVANTSRQSYYASLAPSQGFLFDDEAVVYPFLHEPTNNFHQRVMRRKVHWDGSEQELLGGYIHSRTMSQVIVSRAGDTKARLRVGKVQGDQLTVTNELGATIKYLLVAAEDDRLYEGTNLGPGQAELKLVDATKASSSLSRRLADAAPEYPEGYSENMHNTFFEEFRIGPRSYSAASPANQAVSLLERKLARFTRLNGQPLNKRSYVAFCEAMPEVPSGVSYARELASLHVVEGSW